MSPRFPKEFLKRGSKRNHLSEFDSILEDERGRKNFNWNSKVSFGSQYLYSSAMREMKAINKNIFKAFLISIEVLKIQLGDYG